jgi:acetyl-CoA acyltransferase 1
LGDGAADDDDDSLQFSETVLEHEPAADCLLPMGLTSASAFSLPALPLLTPIHSLSLPGENVAAKYNVSRQQQDAFAARSFQKAVLAQKAGKFEAEIVPVVTKIIDPKTGDETTITVDRDDGMRDGVTEESLSKLKPVFSKTGSTHAGNASQVSFSLDV